MITTIIVNLIAILFAYLAKNNQFKYGLEISFALIFVYLSLRYNFGNDYKAYYDLFSEINYYSNFKSALTIKGNEIGWLYLNRLFEPIGFFGLVGFQSALICFSLYFFVKKYVPKNYEWFAVFLFVFQPYNMLVYSSAMRQSMAISLFIFGIHLIQRQKYIWYLIVVYIATLFHSSAYILFLLILIPVFKFKFNFKTILVTSILFVLPIIFSKQIFDTVNILTSNYADFYGGHIESAETVKRIGLGFFLNVLIILIFLIFARKIDSPHNQVFIKIALISFLILPISFSLVLMLRFNFYLSPVLFVAFPLVFNKIDNLLIRKGYISLIMMLTIYDFIVFFNSEVYHDYYHEYNTIFSSQLL